MEGDDKAKWSGRGSQIQGRQQVSSPRVAWRGANCIVWGRDGRKAGRAKRAATALALPANKHPPGVKVGQKVKHAQCTAVLRHGRA